MIKEFSQLIHLMEQGFTPKDFGSGWKIPQPDRESGEVALVEVHSFAIAQAKRFGCIEIVETPSGPTAVLAHQSYEEGPALPELSNDLTPLSRPERLEALSRTGLMNSPPEECFDRLTRLASKVLKCPISIVSLVSDDRQYIKSVSGLTLVSADDRCTPLQDSFCKFVAANGRELIVNDAATNILTRDLPIVHSHGLLAYAGFPLVSYGGQTLGAFCVIDRKPRRWTTEELILLKEFADMASLCVKAVEMRILISQGHLI